ncbi:Error-prone DNA polymerase [Sphingomonas antarctica]|uniref:error-prone DNA polymerase n=1 Tax=Sphingomonas antarctica TaxID=2040274 RepID=UPI0039E9494D
MTEWAELAAATNFSFLHGASHPSDMVYEAHRLGIKAIGIADRNTVAGVVRAYIAVRDAPDRAREYLLEYKKAQGLPELLTPDEEMSVSKIDLRLIVGARLVFNDGTPDVIAYPQTRKGWGRLTRLLTVGNLRTEKGCNLRLPDLLAHLEDLCLIVVAQPFESSVIRRSTPLKPKRYTDKFQPEQFGTADMFSPKPAAEPMGQQGYNFLLRQLSRASSGNIWLGATPRFDGRHRRNLQMLQSLSRQTGVPLVAIGDPLYATLEDQPLHDVVSCIREGTTVTKAGRLLEANGERHLQSPSELNRLFAKIPEAITAQQDILDRIEFTLDQLRYEYPHEPVPQGWEPMDWLEHITMEAAAKRWPDGIPDKARTMLGEEFALVRDRKYAYYFLTVHDIVKFARAQIPPILCQGRGSAANSIICFLLGITAIDPAEHGLLFSRFVSTEREEPPDIDVDFEHERREEVMQYVYERYGRHRAGIVATVIHYRPRSAVREVGKALGLTEDVTQKMTSTVWGSFSDKLEDQRVEQSGLSLANPEIGRLKYLVDQLLNAPRHLSQHVGGFVLTEDRLDETVPLHWAAMDDRTYVEWDKDDIDALGLMKVDILALGMLTCIRKAFDLMRDNGLGENTLELDLKANDPAVYRMLCKGDSIGVFQVESRAQMNMLPRLEPVAFYDLAIQVAIVRPGPIQGNMVHPYLRRRQRKEDWSFPEPHRDFGEPDELHGILGKTLGVPLFQEQAMKLAIIAADFTPNEANELRRAMATFRHVGGMPRFEEKMIGGMVKRGYEEDFARRCFEQIKGFGSYGFPESHALSFARLVYVSSWIKYYQPAVFCAALLNSQPMGFYAPAQLVRDAREHGVDVREICVNASGWDNRIEMDSGVPAVRLGFRQIDGFKKDWGDAIAELSRFNSIEDLARRSNLPTRALNLLADADALQSLGHVRREGLWEVRRTPPKSLPLFAYDNAPELADEPDAQLPAMPLSEEVVADYQVTRLSLKDHPMTFLRGMFADEGVISCAEYADRRNGSRAKVAGVVLVRQRPGKGNAIFVTLEDETGVCNLVLWARTFERFRLEVMAARVLLAEGEVQRSPEGVMHLMVDRVCDRTGDLKQLSEDHKPKLVLSRADEFEHPQPSRYNLPRGSHPRDVRILPNSRDFH